jgi:hypothetical protein
MSSPLDSWLIALRGRAVHMALQCALALGATAAAPTGSSVASKHSTAKAR